ncbi:hypothetical protein CO2235_MP80218 [Cupriavidus oxalaticus]|uniref:Uncharacterized protein n=1 Tax=Cupriavidus oxalaticus TaxID=96344 RepID=A0A976BJP3_9BURK|nr:hypothetical protein CO2235_MP80218 [Cupriavidus oxalaticus]
MAHMECRFYSLGFACGALTVGLLKQRLDVRQTFDTGLTIAA